MGCHASKAATPKPAVEPARRTLLASVGQKAAAAAAPAASSSAAPTEAAAAAAPAASSRAAPTEAVSLVNLAGASLNEEFVVMGGETVDDLKRLIARKRGVSVEQVKLMRDLDELTNKQEVPTGSITMVLMEAPGIGDTVELPGGKTGIVTKMENGFVQVDGESKWYRMTTVKVVKKAPFGFGDKVSSNGRQGMINYLSRNGKLDVLWDNGHEDEDVAPSTLLLISKALKPGTGAKVQALKGYSGVRDGKEFYKAGDAGIIIYSGEYLFGVHWMRTGLITNEQKGKWPEWFFVTEEAYTVGQAVQCRDGHKFLRLDSVATAMDARQSCLFLSESPPIQRLQTLGLEMWLRPSMMAHV